MRVLDCLCHRDQLNNGHTFGTKCIKNLALVVTFIFSTAFSVQADAAPLVIKSYQDLLVQSKKESADYQKIQSQFEVDHLSAENLVSMYNWTLSAAINREDAESPATSPFAPAGESANVNSNIRLERQTARGISPYVELRTSDVNLNFPGRSGIEFQTASLESGVRLNLMKVIFGRKSLAVLKEQKIRKDLADLAKQNTERDFSVKVLKAYFEYLKSYRQLAILKVQCGEYKTLQKISSDRFRKKLIREQDYLSIEVLQQTCLLDKKNAENNLELDRIALLRTSGLPLETIVNLKAAYFLKSTQVKSVDLKQNLEYKMTEKALQAAQAYEDSLKSDSLPEISFDYGLTSQASEPGVGSSIAETLSFDLITHNLGLSLKYEFGSSNKKINAEKSAAEKRIKSLEFDQIKRSLERDRKKITANLVFLKEAEKKAKKLVELQKRKSALHNKDFRNGRGGIRDLVEAQISYLSSLERSLNFEYNLTLAKIDLHSLSGEKFEAFN